MVRYDVILYGVTGFTGRRAVAYFQEQAPISVRWAIAGRSASKLVTLKQELNLHVDVLVADATNAEEIDQLVQQAQVFLTTVGPYAWYGKHIVGSCAKHGVHYVDITGEAPWVRDMLDQYGTMAKASGAKIIPFCGFDSIPADLGVWLLQQYMRETWQSELVKADGYYFLGKGGLNGGTLLSALNMLEKKEGRRMVNPKLLMNDLSNCNFIPKIKRSWKHHYASDIERWVYPFFMADINTKVVYRSVGLAAEHGLPHPKEFVYQEYHAIGKRVPSMVASIGQVSLGILGQFSLFRKAAKKWGPKAGEGPNDLSIEEGFFKLKIIGQDAQGNRAMMTMSYQGDAGNKATTCFLCEAALALTLDSKLLPNYTGFLTPTIALGTVLFKRLAAAELEMSCQAI